MAGTGLTTALRHRDYRLTLGAFTLSDIGSWGYNVALAVWVFDATGSATWIALITVCRFAPAMLFSAYAGLLAERYDKARFMCVTDLVLLTLSCAMALLMTLDAGVGAVLVVTALLATVSTAHEPAAAALTPHVVPESDLASANALRNTIENLTVIAGPALGALMLLLGTPENAVWLNGLSFLVSALLVARVRTRAPGVDTSEGGEAGVWRQVTAGFRTILGDPAVAVLVGYSVLVTAVFGMDTVLFVGASDELLGTGPDGYGYLLAGLGVGGLLAAPLVTRAESLPSIGPVILAGALLYTVPTLVLLVSHEPVVAFAVQVVRGAATMFVDVLAITALQRAVPSQVMSRVFGVFDTLVLGAILLGSLVASWLLATVGIDAALWVAGAGTAAIALVAAPALVKVDRAARRARASVADRLALLESCRIVEAVADGALTALAREAERLEVAAGDVVVRQGDPADAFYVVESGRLGVAVVGADGSVLSAPTMTDGDWFGEIGLIERVPRTATVTAETGSVLLRFDGEAFLAALTEDRPTVAFLDGAAVRLSRTHPTAVPRHRRVELEEST